MEKLLRAALERAGHTQLKRPPSKENCHLPSQLRARGGHQQHVFRNRYSELSCLPAHCDARSRRIEKSDYEAFLRESVSRSAGICLKVKEHVCWRWRGQYGKPLALFGVLDQLVDEATFLTALHLKACLLADSYVLDEGLEYLIGMATLPAIAGGEPNYETLWALTRAEERKAFETFIGKVMELWRKNPEMHIYHYAPYEPTAIKRLAGKHARCVDEVDELLRAGVFVDLYRCVRQGIRASVGELFDQKSRTALRI